MRYMNLNIEKGVFSRTFYYIAIRKENNIKNSKFVQFLMPCIIEEDAENIFKIFFTGEM